ncbi:hypothetical protein LX32DRAFT_368335 [Colletotrichum zoysiae]|uniref:Uncharacterized protein n=1 Tax=Colletotrichum zoysiae TaxID=1216348 RepID=A0AAD9M5Y3_9PEZI|nr:hypothetical protein LX32DRAFT_368335 [Colletotrichum zoysiae]
MKGRRSGRQPHYQDQSLWKKGLAYTYTCEEDGQAQIWNGPSALQSISALASSRCCHVWACCVGGGGNWTVLFGTTCRFRITCCRR